MIMKPNSDLSIILWKNLNFLWKNWLPRALYELKKKTPMGRTSCDISNPLYMDKPIRNQYLGSDVTQV